MNAISTTASETLEQNKAVARRWTNELFNGGNVAQSQAAVDEITTPDFVDHALPYGFPAGREGLKMTVQVFHTAFPDVYSRVEDVVAEGDKVVIRWTAGGTHKGDFFGLPPTGRSGTTSGIHIMRIVAGRIAEHWSNSDDAGLMRQLTSPQ